MFVSQCHIALILTTRRFVSTKSFTSKIFSLLDGVLKPFLLTKDEVNALVCRYFCLCRPQKSKPLSSSSVRCHGGTLGNCTRHRSQTKAVIMRQLQVSCTLSRNFIGRGKGTTAHVRWTFLRSYDRAYALGLSRK